MLFLMDPSVTQTKHTNTTQHSCNIPCGYKHTVHHHKFIHIDMTPCHFSGELACPAQWPCLQCCCVCFNENKEGAAIHFMSDSPSYSVQKILSTVAEFCCMRGPLFVQLRTNKTTKVLKYFWSVRGHCVQNVKFQI